MAKRSLFIFYLCISAPALGGLSLENDPDDELDFLGREIPCWTCSSPSRSARIDRSSFADGKATVTFNTGADLARGVALQTNGRIVIVGRSRTPDPGYQDIGLARLMRNGSPDTSFGTTGRVVTNFGTGDDYPHSVSLFSDGRMAVAGRATNGSNLDFSILRYHSNGTLDTAFNTTGGAMISIGTSVDIARSVVVDTSSRVLAAGYRFDGSKHDSTIVRLQTDGTLDTAYATTGKLVFTAGTAGSSLTAARLQTDGRLLVIGGLNVSGLNWNVLVARFTTNGTLDTSFSTSGKLELSIGTDLEAAYSMDFDSAARLIVGGYTKNSAGNLALLALRLTSNGRLDTSFKSSGTLTYSVASYQFGQGYVLAGESDSFIIAATKTSDSDPSASDFAIVRFSSDATLLHTGYSSDFNNDADVVNAVVHSSHPKSEILVVGSTQNGTKWDYGLSRHLYSTGIGYSGMVDYAFRTVGTFTSENMIPFFLPDGRYLAGYATSLNRHLADGSLDTSFNTTGQKTGLTLASNLTIYALQTDARVVISTLYTNSIGRLHTNGTIDTSFGTAGYTYISGGEWLMGMRLNSSGQLYGVTSLGKVYRLHTNGGVDTSFRTTGSATLSLHSYQSFSAIELNTLGNPLLGGFVAHNGGGRHTNRGAFLVRLSSNGTFDTTFATTGKLTLRGAGYDVSFAGMLLDSDDRTNLAHFETALNAENIMSGRVYRIHTNGSLDTAFNQVGYFEEYSGGINQFAPLGIYQTRSRTHLYVLGNNQWRAITRLNSNGSLDTSFGTGGFLGNYITPVSPVIEDPEGNLFVRGTRYLP